MFLNELNKREATIFISLIENLAKVDKVYSDREKQLVNNYIEELSLSTEGREVLTFESSVIKLNDSTDRIKNIIYFELVGVALLDGLYEDKELDFLNKLAISFNISKEKQKAYEGYFKKVKFTYDMPTVDTEGKIKEIEILAEKLLVE